MIETLGIVSPARIVDVGGGPSSLVDALVVRGFQVTVLDIAEAALAIARDRLGPDADKVDWQVVDITHWRPGAQYDLWHDRAVFHFLTEAGDRAAYLSALNAGVAPGGAVILATFAEDGPERCTGLPVRRYSADALAAELGSGFHLVRHTRETHQTPWGSEQSFTWAAFRRSS
jgi:trans-aconitate methyltransferase